MKRIFCVIGLCIILSGCTLALRTAQERAAVCACKTDRKTRQVAQWVRSIVDVSQPGTSLIVCEPVADVIFPVRVRNVAVLFVETEMPLAQWWHMNDVAMAYNYEAFLLGDRDLHQLEDKAYYREKLLELMGE